MPGRKTHSTPAYELTRFTFTGQYTHMDNPLTPQKEGFGLTCTRQGVFYNARYYDPALGRFAQADSLVPEQSQGVQAWDRYAYVNNNPVRYDDPTGHCAMLCTAAIGAVIGASINVGLYIWSETQQSDGFNLSSDSGDLVRAALQGAAIGGLIGSGVGASEGLALIAGEAGLGAASNLVSDQVGNLITGDNYNATTTSIDAVMGGFTGVATMRAGGLAANSIAGGLNVLNYGLNSAVTKDSVTPGGMAGSFASGFVGQAWSTSSASSMMQPHYEDFGEGVMRMTYKGASSQEAKIFSNTITPAFQAWGESIIGYFHDHAQ